MGWKKTYEKVKAKQEKIEKLIEKCAPEIVTIKQCNKMLETVPDHRESWSAREVACAGLNSIVMGFNNQIGEYNTLVDKLEQQFADKGDKKPNGADTFIATARQQSAVWKQYEQSLQNSIARMEESGEFENVKF